jgi:taurine dioxygenase
VTFVEAFPQFSILRGFVITTVGGDTLWANNVAACRDLPGVLRAAADALWGRFSNLYDYVGRDGSQSADRDRYCDDVITSTIYGTDHQIVRIHPIPGERALILGYRLDRLIGLNRAGSQRLFAMLQDHIAGPENVVRWRWHAGDVAIRDNREAQHKAVDGYGDAARIVRRVVVSGPVSVG